MKCEACKGKGFNELEHGLVMVGCEPCDGTGEIPEPLPIQDLSSIKTKEEANRVATEMLGRICPPDKEIDDSPSDSGIGQANQPAGGEDTSKPKRTKESKAHKKATKRARKVLPKARKVLPI